MRLALRESAEEVKEPLLSFLSRLLALAGADIGPDPIEDV